MKSLLFPLTNWFLYLYNANSISSTPNSPNYFSKIAAAAITFPSSFPLLLAPLYLIFSLAI